MKIRKVKWKSHPVLGDLALDFTNRLGEPYDTIVFAGENGAGKSTILANLSSFLNLGPFSNFEYIEYEVDDAVFTAIPPDSGTNHPNFFGVRTQDGITHQVTWDRSNSPSMVEKSTFDPRKHGCVYSKARADYKTTKITSVSTTSIDSQKYDADESDDFTALKQLLVDVTNSDNASYVQANIKLGTTPMSWLDFYRDSKLYRFAESFNNFFEDIKFRDIVDEGGEKQIRFEKFNSLIPIDKLSTGEKQIVFRGSHLLRNSGILLDGIIFVDEPELSMHPKWQGKILSYYTGLFTKNHSKAQMFFATHSDHVVKAALSDDRATVITLFRENSILTSQKHVDSLIFPTMTGGEANYRAFDLPTIDFHIELYGYLQEKENKQTVKSCDQFIAASIHYDETAHRKPSSFNKFTFETLPTYIRNAIHHPNNGNSFTKKELRASIELLCKLCS